MDLKPPTRKELDERRQLQLLKRGAELCGIDVDEAPPHYEPGCVYLEIPAAEHGGSQFYVMSCVLIQDARAIICARLRERLAAQGLNYYGEEGLAALVEALSDES